jgi:hypothetical protein
VPAQAGRLCHQALAVFGRAGAQERLFFKVRLMEWRPGLTLMDSRGRLFLRQTMVIIRHGRLIHSLVAGSAANCWRTSTIWRAARSTAARFVQGLRIKDFSAARGGPSSPS